MIPPKHLYTDMTNSTKMKKRPQLYRLDQPFAIPGTLVHLSFLTAAILFVSCSARHDAGQSAELVTDDNIVTVTDAQYKNAGVAIGKIELKTISHVLRVNGVIDVPPQNMVSVSVPLGGYLKYTKLLPGMHIRRGEVMAVLEDQQYIQLQQDFLTAKAQLSYIAHEYQRQKELNQSKASSDKVFQQTESDYISAKILVNALGEKLKLIQIDPKQLNEDNISKSIQIHSPIDGYVSKVFVNIGKYMQPSEVLFELIDPSDIHLALTIFEKDLDKIAVGQKLVAFTNNKPSTKYPCEVIFITKDLSLERSALVHCHFEGHYKDLIPGMYMNAEIELKNNSAYALPEDAIVRYKNIQYVFLAKSDKVFEMLEVNTNNAENGFVEIVSGEALVGKAIVIRGAYPLLMKMKNKADL